MSEDMLVDIKYWPEEDDNLDIFQFFKECPDIRPPENMRDMPRFCNALRKAGQTGWSDYFGEWYGRLCQAIEEEVTIHA